MFERFDAQAIKVVMLSQEEARRLGHNFVGTEQILLGIIGEGGAPAKLLRSLGVRLLDARTEIEKIVGRGSGFVAREIPFTPRAKRVLSNAWEEARKIGHNYISPPTILLGLLRETEGVSARVLENLGTDLDVLYKLTLEQTPDKKMPAEPVFDPSRLIARILDLDSGMLDLVKGNLKHSLMLISKPCEADIEEGVRSLVDFVTLLKSIK
jgi:ATP-dependent Clp protease ATP-binding subunit ClpA